MVGGESRGGRGSKTRRGTGNGKEGSSRGSKRNKDRDNHTGIVKKKQKTSKDRSEGGGRTKKGSVVSFEKNDNMDLNEEDIETNIGHERECFGDGHEKTGKESYFEEDEDEDDEDDDDDDDDDEDDDDDDDDDTLNTPVPRICMVEEVRGESVSRLSSSPGGMSIRIHTVKDVYDRKTLLSGSDRDLWDKDIARIEKQAREVLWDGIHLVYENYRKEGMWFSQPNSFHDKDSLCSKYFNSLGLGDKSDLWKAMFWQTYKERFVGAIKMKRHMARQQIERVLESCYNRQDKKWKDEVEYLREIVQKKYLPEPKCEEVETTLDDGTKKITKGEELKFEEQSREYKRNFICPLFKLYEFIRLAPEKEGDSEEMNRNRNKMASTYKWFVQRIVSAVIGVEKFKKRCARTSDLEEVIPSSAEACALILLDDKLERMMYDIEQNKKDNSDRNRPETKWTSRRGNVLNNFDSAAYPTYDVYKKRIRVMRLKNRDKFESILGSGKGNGCEGGDEQEVIGEAENIRIGNEKIKLVLEDVLGDSDDEDDEGGEDNRDNMVEKNGGLDMSKISYVPL